jgi:hypothetical protein
LQAKGITQDLRVYFVAGQNESTTIIADMMAMYDALIDAGQDESEMYFLSEPDGAHSEWFWAREYPDAYEWLFDELILAYQSIPANNVTLFPNPVSDFLTITAPDAALTYSIYSITGQLILSGVVENRSIDTSGLSTGLFYIELRDTDLQTVHVSRFVKR